MIEIIPGHDGDYRGPLEGIQRWIAQPEVTRYGPAAFDDGWTALAAAYVSWRNDEGRFGTMASTLPPPPLTASQSVAVPVAGSAGGRNTRWIERLG
jgi:hypothetical protein